MAAERRASKPTAPTPVRPPPGEAATGSCFASATGTLPGVGTHSIDRWSLAPVRRGIKPHPTRPGPHCTLGAERGCSWPVWGPVLGSRDVVGCSTYAAAASPLYPLLFSLLGSPGRCRWCCPACPWWAWCWLARILLARSLAVAGADADCTSAGGLGELSARAAAGWHPPGPGPDTCGPVKNCYR